MSEIRTLPWTESVFILSEAHDPLAPPWAEPTGLNRTNDVANLPGGTMAETTRSRRRRNQLRGLLEARVRCRTT
jgi:hypothetical protein